MGPSAGAVSHGSGLVGYGAGVMGRQDDCGTELVGPVQGRLFAFLLLCFHAACGVPSSLAARGQ